jgi:hypothetical protein
MTSKADLTKAHAQGWNDGYGGAAFDPRHYKGLGIAAYIDGFQEGQANQANGLEADGLEADGPR